MPKTKVLSEVDPGKVTDQTRLVAETGGQLQRVDLLPVITDPDNNPLSEETVSSDIVPVMEHGGLDRSSGEERDEPTYSRTADFIEVENGVSYTFSNDQGVKICAVAYDSSYKFVTAWNEGYSYAWVKSGESRTFPAPVAYIRFYTNVTSDLSNKYVIFGGGGGKTE